jgi:hypothetical protein
MFLKLDENNYIEGYAIIGSIDGAIEVDLDETDIPFPYYQAYQYVDGEIRLDETKLKELIEAEQNQPLSETEELKQRIAKLESIIESLIALDDTLVFDAGAVIPNEYT